MASKGQPKSSKPLFPRHAIQAHKPVLFIGEGAKMNCSISAFDFRLSLVVSHALKSPKRRKRSKNSLPDFFLSIPLDRTLELNERF